MTTTPQTKPSGPVDDFGLEDVLSWLLLMQPRHKLPRLTSINVPEGESCVTLRVAGYHEVRAWSRALGDAGEPDRHTAHEDSIIWWTAHLPQIRNSWSVEITARVQMPIAVALNDDTIDALEMLPAELGAVTA